MRMRVVALDPMPGFYKLRLVKRGPWVPCRIRWQLAERDPDTGERLGDDLLIAEIAGQDQTDAFDVWAGCHEITASEFDYLTRRRKFLLANRPDAPENYPRESINISKLPPIF